MTENFEFLADENDVHMKYQNYLLFAPNTVAEYSWSIANNIVIGVYFRCLEIWMNYFCEGIWVISKGQIISKAICVFLTSPQKRVKKWKKLTW